MMMALPHRQELDRYRLDFKSHHSQTPVKLCEQGMNARKSPERNVLHSSTKNTPNKISTPGRVRDLRATPHRAKPCKTALRTRDPKEVLQELLATIKPPSLDSVIIRELDIMKELFMLKNEYKADIQNICKYKKIQTMYIEKDRTRALGECKDNGIKSVSINGLYNNMLHRLLDRVESEIQKIKVPDITVQASLHKEEGKKEGLVTKISGSLSAEDLAKDKKNRGQGREGQEFQKRYTQIIHKGDHNNQCSVGQQTNIEKYTPIKRSRDVCNLDTVGSCSPQQSSNSNVHTGNIENYAKEGKRQRREDVGMERNESAQSINHTETMFGKVNESEQRQLKLWKKQLFETKSRFEDEEEPNTDLSCLSLFSLHNTLTSTGQTEETKEVRKVQESIEYTASSSETQKDPKDQLRQNCTDKIPSQNMTVDLKVKGIKNLSHKQENVCHPSWYTSL